MSVQSPSSPSQERLAIIRDHLQGFAELMEWAISGKTWMTIAQYQDWMKRQEIKEKKEILYELKRRKWIETKTIGGRLMGRLTNAGWQMALRDQIRRENKRCADGYCFLIFDIPESQRAVRKMLRQFIKECGFKRVQHSVWMTDKDVAKLLLLLLQRRKLDRWVRIIKGRLLSSSPLDIPRAIRMISNSNKKNKNKIQNLSATK